MTPQQKKQLSYKRDCRNCYGENSKSSRKNIRRRHAIQHRRYRHAVKQTLMATSDLDMADLAVKSIRRGSWKKVSDIPLQEFIAYQVKRRINTGQMQNG